jgi:hypothetical protein
VSRLVAILIPLAVVACAPDQSSVESNVRMPGEPSTVARTLTETEQHAAVEAMQSAQPADYVARPLARAGARGRWTDVRDCAILAAKDCEVAMVRQDPLRDGSGAVIGTLFTLRSLHDQVGTMRVTGSESAGVTGVEVSMGNFGEQGELAQALLRAFQRELADEARILRPQ